MTERSSSFNLRRHFNFLTVALTVTFTIINIASDVAEKSF